MVYKIWLGARLSLVSLLLLQVTMSTKLGGMSEDTKVPNDEVKQIVEQMKPIVEEKHGKTFDIFEPVSYRTQLVAGTNYFIKVDVGNENYAHLRVYKNLRSELTLTAALFDKKKSDDLEYFQ